MADLPIIGITMGDPASIGPEIAVKALLNEEIYAICKPLLVGDAAVFEDIIKRLGLQASINVIKNVKEAKFTFGAIDVYDLHNVNLEELRFGEISAMAGSASFEAIKKVIDLALTKDIDATVTGPINKKSINEAGHHFAGHTETLDVLERRFYNLAGDVPDYYGIYCDREGAGYGSGGIRFARDAYFIGTSVLCTVFLATVCL